MIYTKFILRAKICCTLYILSKTGRSTNFAELVVRIELRLYLNEGYEWVIDLDIEKYFDTVNHDKLISILRERINDAKTRREPEDVLRCGQL